MTMAVAFSDAEIRRQAADPSAVLMRDPRHPGLYFRFTEARPRGTWYLVVRKRWNRIGAYPDLPTKTVLAALPDLRQRLASDTQASAAVSAWSTLGELLAWYSDRMSRDRSLSAKRKATAKSAIACHLIPRVGGLAFSDVRHGTLDAQLMWPLQATLSLEFVRLIFGLLVVACRRAHTLGLIPSNPMAGIKFSDFSKAKIKAKAARLRGVQIEPLLAQLEGVWAEEPADAMLALLMLCHGTRVGETRMAQWPHFSLAERKWHIPAEHTKTRVEHSLPLTDQACVLLTQYRDTQLASGYTGQYLFPARNGKGMSEGQASAVFARLGKGEWTSHDLRKLARTGWADLGIDFLIGEMLINHAMGHNVQAYIHTTVEERKRIALEQWHAHLDGKGLILIHGLKEGRNEDSRNALEAAQNKGCGTINKTTIGEDSK
ncbi:tyrosine-type recombinase/integrase [Pseudomonas laurentiana]|uniref:Tyrosine-type recombinase/integrase n=1 Tax=Pseudomonas laurentiana TaxID=2364649 RepID=A0A6I5RP90_9PSED|nr:site-specific integrase [Pseudomonas laurentiana]NES09737.1 tyrosine-type recombinase/integrase [Pseudomonas laurentiana]